MKFEEISDSQNQSKSIQMPQLYIRSDVLARAEKLKKPGVPGPKGPWRFQKMTV